MKTAILSISILALTTLGTQAASGGGSAGGGASKGGALLPAMPARPTMPTTSGSAQTGTTTPNQPDAAANPSAVGANNNMASSNQFMMNSNRFRGSNGLAPTGAASGTDQFHREFLRHDHAVTASDQTLLTTLDQTIHTQLGIPVSDELPVHLIIDNGAVTLVGFVPTAAEQQRILLQLQQTPGVLQVVNRLHVGMPTTPVSPSAQENPSAQTSPLTPAFGAGQVDRAFSLPDQRLLQTVRQAAATQLGINENGTPSNTFVAPPMPVHFVVQNGVVTVTGMVVTDAQRFALLAALGRVQGVVRVVDNMQVGGANAVPQSGMTTTSQ